MGDETKMKRCLFCSSLVNRTCPTNGENPDGCEDYCLEEKLVQDRFPLIKGKISVEKQSWIRAISFDFKDTPKSLYRFLYLWQPTEVDFSDMYKGGLAVIDLNGVGLVLLKFYKFELVAYLYAPQSELKPRPQAFIEISSEIPATENEEFIDGSKAKEEFEIFGSLLEWMHTVYAGNNFEV